MALAGEITVDSLMNMINTFGVDNNVGTLAGDIDNYRYVGFDPIVTLKALHDKAKTAGLTPKLFLSDMFEICLIGVMRGTAFGRQNFMDRCTAQLKTRITELKARYDIKMNTSNDKAAKAVTAGRVMAVFPEFVGAILCAPFARTVTTVDSLPVFFSFPGAPSIMSDDAFNAHQAKYLDFMIKFSMTVNPTVVNDDVTKQKQITIIQSQRQGAFNISKRKNIRKVMTAFKLSIQETGKDIGEKNSIGTLYDSFLAQIGQA